MEVNEVLQSMQSFYLTQMAARTQGGEGPPQGGISSVDLDISAVGNLRNMMRNMISSMSEEERAEMQAFDEEVRKAIESGDFDAAEMAEKAPEKLKALAEENGLDLEEMLKARAEMLKARMEGEDCPLVGLYNSNGIGIPVSYQDQIVELLNKFFADEDSEVNVTTILSGA
jgi:hypothetical protein